LKLDETIALSWGLVLIPFYLMVTQFMATILLYDGLELCYQGMFRFDTSGYRFKIWKLLFKKRKFRDLIYASMLSLVAFFILLAIKLAQDEGDDSALEWWAVFLPIWAFLMYFFSMPLTGGCGSHTARIKVRNCCERFWMLAGFVVTTTLPILFIFLRIAGEHPLFFFFLPISCLCIRSYLVDAMARFYSHVDCLWFVNLRWDFFRDLGVL